MPEKGAIERALQFLRRSLELTADSFHQIEGGWTVLTPSLPQVWNLNHIEFTAPVSSAKALQLADEHLADVPYRHIAAGDELGRAWEAPLKSEGFKVEREVVMTIASGSKDAPGAEAADVIEAGEQAMVELMSRWYEEGGRGRSETQQLVEASRREARAWGERRFGIAGDDGKLAAITKLRSDGRTAQVEDVYTAPEARGRGYARTLVGHAISAARLAGHDLIFIVADDDDWPKHLYARLGFRPAALRWAFHREPARPARNAAQES